MLIVKIISEELEDRFVDLGEGVHIVGSSISSDIVLLDEQIDPLHFLIKVSLQGVEVEMSPDSSGIFQRSSDETSRPAEPGAVMQWGWGDTLALGGIRIQMQGSMLRDPASPVPEPEAGRKTRGHWLIKLAGSVAIGLMASVLLLTQVGAVEIEQADALPGEMPTDGIGAGQSAKLDRQEILAGLQMRGLQVTGFARSGDAWTGVIRVADMAEQDRIAASLEALAPHFSPRFFADDRLAAAADVVIRSTAPKASIATVAAGVITVRGLPADSPQAERLRANLQADVPGVQSVIFDSGLQQSAEMLGSKIAGTWAGEFPYVLLEGGKTVRPGEEVGKDTLLVQVRQNSIVIEIDRSRHEVILQ